VPVVSCRTRIVLEIGEPVKAGHSKRKANELCVHDAGTHTIRTAERREIGSGHVRNILSELASILATRPWRGPTDLSLAHEQIERIVEQAHEARRPP
jgi:hypothetical protein